MQVVLLVLLQVVLHVLHLTAKNFQVAQFKGSTSNQMRTGPFAAGDIVNSIAPHCIGPSLTSHTTAGGFQPGKMKAEERWRPRGEEQVQEAGPRPRVHLRSSAEVLTQGGGAAHSTYRCPPYHLTIINTINTIINIFINLPMLRMPPGTSRGKIAQEWEGKQEMEVEVQVQEVQ